jgi:hypothetical protein
MITEAEARQQVKNLQRFYMDGLVFITVNVLLILVWAITDTSSIFWPKYVLLVWGMVLLFKAYRLDILHFFIHQFTFLASEWEEKKIKELSQNHRGQRRIKLHQSRKHSKTNL